MNICDMSVYHGTVCTVCWSGTTSMPISPSCLTLTSSPPTSDYTDMEEDPTGFTTAIDNLLLHALAEDELSFTTLGGLSDEIEVEYGGDEEGPSQVLMLEIL